MSDKRLATTRIRAANLSRIGGEMYAWSDLDQSRGPAVAHSGPLRYLLSELSSHGLAVLVAGPHDEEIVLSLVQTGAAVTWLVRSLGDAERLAARFPNVNVLCGSIAKVETSARFDLVIAADGPDRLISAEGEQQTTSDVLRVLASLVVPGGILALMYDNILGIHHTVELNPGGHYESDGSWYPFTEHEYSRPMSLAQLEEQLLGEGLETETGYAVYPTPHAPSLFVGRDLLGETASPLRGQLGAVVSRSFAAEYREQLVLSDPRRLAVRALRAGAEAVLAPAWLTIARRGRRDAPAPRHEILVGHGGDSYTAELSAPGGRPRIDVLVAPTVVERAGMRRLTGATGYALASGQIFEERLLQLCAYADLPGIRVEIDRFVRWLEAQGPAGAIAGPAALSTTDSVIDDGYDLHLVPAHWEPMEPVAAGTVVVRALWSFAVRLIVGNYPHPWHITASAEELTSILLTTIGRTLSQGELRTAVDLEVAQRTADEGLTPAQQDALRLKLLDVQASTATVDVLAYRSLADAVWRQQYELTHVRSMLEWTEQIIKSRDLQLSRMDWEMRFYQSTWAGRLITILRAAYRLTRRELHTAVRSIRTWRKTDKRIKDATEF